MIKVLLQLLVSEIARYNRGKHKAKDVIWCCALLASYIVSTPLSVQDQAAAAL